MGNSWQWTVGSGQLVVLCGTLLVLLLAVPSVAFAQSVTADDVNVVAEGLFCPVCESEPLDTCQTQACEDWREEIRAQLEDGATKDQIHQDFRARYGDRVLAQPPADGFNLVLWLGLPIAVILGGVAFGRYLRAIRQIKHVPQAEGKVSAEASDDDYIRRIEDEIANNS